MARPPDLVRTTDGAHTLTIGEQSVVEGFDYRAVAEGTATLLQALQSDLSPNPFLQIPDTPQGARSSGSAAPPFPRPVPAL